MYHFRGDLIRDLIAAGHMVYALVPEGDYVHKIEQLGAKCEITSVSRFISPVMDLTFLWQVFWICRRERFDIVHNMTIKPNIFGTFAAKLAGIPRVVCLVSGMGFVFGGDRSFRERVVRFLVSPLYRLALHLADRTWFQNPDDCQNFVDLGLLPKSKSVVIRSGGINLETFNPVSVSEESLNTLRNELGIPSDAKCAAMIAARMIWSKGVREFVEAAKALETQLPDWHFIMLCPRDEESWDSVPQSYIDEMQLANMHVVDTFRPDVKSFVALADIMVLPSYYPEGVPRILLEALAMEKPIITTDHPGCRETVDVGKNGWLIPPRDAEAVANGILGLANNENQRLLFGLESRAIAARDFDSNVVVRRIVEEVYRI